MTDKDLQQALQEKFGLSEFRLGQKHIIESVLMGKDVLALMPTGGGKSLCYQLPAMMGSGLTVVISPLIALMNDQVEALKALGLPAGCLHSGMGPEERRQVFGAMAQGGPFLLYLSPERIQKEGFRPWLEKQEVCLFAIDEAHCVSQWGHDFRPEYSQLRLLRQIKSQVPMMGLTATATPLVKRDIIEHLGLMEPDQHVYGFYRPNLYYQVEFCEDESEKESFVLQALRQTPEGRVIIYCGTRRKTEEWADALAARGESVAHYHAGLSPKERIEIEKDYMAGKTRILAATNAFGMGVDHPDVRMVIHTQMPGNIESYYQEVGRAGRDGLPSTCLMAYSKKDRGLQAYFINSSEASEPIKAQRWRALNAMIQYAEGSECRHGDILTYFKDQKRINKCGHCDSCDPKSDRRVRASKGITILRKPKGKKKKKEAALVAQLTQDQEWKLDQLRQWRKDYAKEHDIPAFMVFSDKTLRDIVVKSPTNEDELAQVYGLGEKKIEVFGQTLLEQINP